MVLFKTRIAFGKKFSSIFKPFNKSLSNMALNSKAFSVSNLYNFCKSVTNSAVK